LLIIFNPLPFQFTLMLLHPVGPYVFKNSLYIKWMLHFKCKSYRNCVCLYVYIKNYELWCINIWEHIFETINLNTFSIDMPQFWNWAPFLLHLWHSGRWHCTCMMFEFHILLIFLMYNVHTFVPPVLCSSDWSSFGKAAAVGRLLPASTLPHCESSDTLLQ
jgi:hypothetical protein